MNPVLFRIGAIPISSFGVFLLLAFWVGIAMTRRRSPAIGIDRNAMLDVALYMIIGGILGARLGYVIANLGTFVSEPVGILTIWRDSGLTFYGAVGGAALVASGYAGRRGISTLRLLDVTAPGLALGYAVAMIGALLHGLFPGKPTGVPWAVPLGFEAVHPTQIYLLLAAVGIYLVLVTQRKAAAGVPFLTFLLLHAVSRFLVDFFVASEPVLGPFTLAQLAALVVGLASLLILIDVVRRYRPEEAQAGWTPEAELPGEPPPT